MWKEGDGTPYDGFYNGRVDLMIRNGTYADFRPLVLQRAERGKYAAVGTSEERKEKSLKRVEDWDREWEKLTIEERLRLRNRVADDAALKEVIVHTARGPQRFLRATPSENNNLDKQTKLLEKKIPQRLPSGSIKRDDLPPGLSVKLEKAVVLPMK